MRNVPTPLQAARVVLAFMALAFATEGRASAADPTAAECVAANKQSLKLRTAKKLRQARDQAQTCAATSCSLQVRAACKKRVTELTAQIPTIVFLAKDDAGHDLTAVKVSMDGESLADHLDGTPFLVDVGPHTFTFEVEGQPPVDKPFIIMQTNKNRREVITLAAPPPPPPPPADVGVASKPDATPDANEGGSSHGPLRTVAWITGGVGVAGLVAGGVLGGLAISKWSASQNECSSTQCPSHAQAISDHDSASSLATVSTVLFVAGGAALATGTLLFFLSPSRGDDKADEKPKDAATWRASPMVGPRCAGLLLEGVF